MNLQVCGCVRTQNHNDMKTIEGLERKEVCGISILVPVGEKSADFSKIISLNETSLFLWKKMENRDFTAEQLLEALLSEYDIDEVTARNDVDALIEQLKKEGLIVE